MEFLCKSLNKKKIFFDPVNSHTSTHFDDTPGLKKLATEVLQQRDLETEIESFEVDMGRVIGQSSVVLINSKDVIIYAKRIKREDQGYVPFVKGRKTEQCSILSLYLVQKDTDSYELSSTWIGEIDSPPFPQMSNATAESTPYWSKRAFVWGSQKTIPGSEIVKCPW